jgi:hypothetical protein
MKPRTTLFIEIINWDKYNPKRDQQSYTWLRLNNDIATDPDLFGLSAAQKFVWIEILCQASRKNKGTILVNLEQISHVTQVKIQEIMELIDFLEQKPICRTHDNARSPIVVGTTPTNETNERDETNETNEQTPKNLKFDFEILYKKYPLKKGKADGISRLKKTIKTQEDFDLCSKAIDKYTQQLILERTEPKFIKHFSTFVSTWKDWLDLDAASSILNFKPTNKSTQREQSNMAALEEAIARHEAGL